MYTCRQTSCNGRQENTDTLEQRGKSFMILYQFSKIYWFLMNSLDANACGSGLCCFVLNSYQLDSSFVIFRYITSALEHNVDLNRMKAHMASKKQKAPITFETIHHLPYTFVMHCQILNCSRDLYLAYGQILFNKQPSHQKISSNNALKQKRYWIC